MKPKISHIPATPLHKEYYLVVFETLSDRTRWLQQQGFTYEPSDLVLARWTRLPSAPYRNFILEMTPLAPEHKDQIRALCMKVTGHKVKQHECKSHPPSHEAGHPSAATLGQS